MAQIPKSFPTKNAPLWTNKGGVPLNTIHIVTPLCKISKAKNLTFGILTFHNKENKTKIEARIIQRDKKEQHEILSKDQEDQQQITPTSAEQRYDPTETTKQQDLNPINSTFEV